MYPVKTKYIVADFGHGKSIYENIKQQMQLLDVGILINNVGRMYDFPDELSNISEDLLWQIMNINVGAVTMMTRMVIPQMKANRRGIIVNISSGSECQPAPMMAVYGATKVFVKNFTLGENLTKTFDVKLLKCRFYSSHRQGTRRVQRSSAASDANVCDDQNEQVLDQRHERQHFGARRRVVHKVSRLYARKKLENDGLLESRHPVRLHEGRARVHQNARGVRHE